MRQDGCEECDRLWTHYQQIVGDSNVAAEEYKRLARTQDLRAAGDAQQRLQGTEHGRVEARQQILLHEKFAHPSSKASFS